MAAIITVALVTVAAFGTGRGILRLLRVRTSTPGEEIAYSVALGYGAAAYAVFALGLAGVLYPWVLGALLALMVVLVVRERSSGVQALRGLAAAARGGAAPLAGVLGALLVICATANLIAALAPPTGGDALTYHLAVPKIWLDEHRVTSIPWRWPSLGPFAMQMLYLLVMALQGLPSPSVLAWTMGVTTAIALVGVGSKFPRSFPPLLAAGIFYTMSTVGQNAADTRIDLGLTLFVTLAILAGINYLTTREPNWLIVAGLCAGLAAGTKHTGAAAAAVLVLGIAAFRPSQTDRSLRAGLRAAGVVALVAAGVAAPWYLRSLALTGDPAYPFLTAVGGDPALRASLSELVTRYGPGKSLADFAVLPLYVTGAVGPPYLGLAPFSLALWRTAQLRFVWFVLAGLAAVWFLTAQAIRFLLPALPVAAAVAALGFAVLDERSTTLRRAARAAVVVGLGVATAITIYHDAGYARAAAGLESREAYLLRMIDNHDDIVWMNAHLPRDARVLFLARTGFYLERRYTGAGPRADDDLRRWIAAQRVSHIYCLAERCEAIARSGVQVEILRESLARAKPRSGKDRTPHPALSRVLRVVGP